MQIEAGDYVRVNIAPNVYGIRQFQVLRVLSVSPHGTWVKLPNNAIIAGFTWVPTRNVSLVQKVSKEDLYEQQAGGWHLARQHR